MIKIFLGISLLSFALLADEADDIIKRIDQNMRGESVYSKVTMQISTQKHTRSMQIESWSKGKKKNFVKILNPSKDRGITFLSLDGQMWQYIPKIERTIKIPPSMMLQNWMGSDISNDDMVKQSSIVDDYNAKLLSKKGKIAIIQLTPKPNASVVWGKIVSKVDTTHYTGIEDKFYDENGVQVRVFRYANVKKFGKYYIPTKWTIKPSNNKGHSTTMTINQAKYDIPINSNYFTKSAMKRYSR